jgi:hypothetical protein
MDSNNQSDEPDDLRSIDQALLLALSRTPRGGVPLTADQEQLLDAWLTGRLSEVEADRAVALTKQNAFAAEHILERRLVTAAEAGSAVPAALSLRIMKVAQPAELRPRSLFRFRWPILSSLQWSAAGAAVAATIAAGVFGVLALRENTQTYQRVQLAMVTIDDRRALSGTPQYRTLRSDGTAPAAVGCRDVDIPVDLLRRAIASAEGAERGAVAAQLLVYLPSGPEIAEQTQLAIDSTLADRLSGEWNGRLIAPVRAYNLDHASMRAIRENLKAQAGTVLLTVRR